MFICQEKYVSVCLSRLRLYADISEKVRVFTWTHCQFIINNQVKSVHTQCNTSVLTWKWVQGRRQTFKHQRWILISTWKWPENQFPWSIMSCVRRFRIRTSVPDQKWITIDHIKLAIQFDSFGQFTHALNHFSWDTTKEADIYLQFTVKNAFVGLSLCMQLANDSVLQVNTIYINYSITREYQNKAWWNAPSWFLTTKAKKRTQIKLLRCVLYLLTLQALYQPPYSPYGVLSLCFPWTSQTHSVSDSRPTPTQTPVMFHTHTPCSSPLSPPRASRWACFQLQTNTQVTLLHTITQSLIKATEAQY